MQPKCYNETFQEVLAASEPRTPVMVLHLDLAGVRAHRADVRVVLNDSLTCEQLGEYFVNPIHALHLLHRASMFALNGELTESADFVCELYAVCNARYEADRCRAQG